MAEMYDIRLVKDEFLRAIAQQYLQIYSEMQFEASIALLTEFCNNVANNQLALVRVGEQPQPPLPEFETSKRPTEDPFAAEHVRRDVEELNKDMPRRTPEKESEVEIDLGGERKRSFVDKVRDMRSFKKDVNRINPED